MASTAFDYVLVVFIICCDSSLRTVFGVSVAFDSFDFIDSPISLLTSFEDKA